MSSNVCGSFGKLRGLSAARVQRQPNANVVTNESRPSTCKDQTQHSAGRCVLYRLLRAMRFPNGSSTHETDNSRKLQILTRNADKSQTEYNWLYKSSVLRLKGQSASTQMCGLRSNACREHKPQLLRNVRAVTVPQRCRMCQAHQRLCRAEISV